MPWHGPRRRPTRPHVRFGRRAAETDRPKVRHRAAVRPHHVGIRLDEEKLCLLVLIGVRVDGTKELVALADGYRESTGSWADLLRDCKRRGMHAPVLAVGDGALGFWGALREVFPETREQRCWFHRARKELSCSVPGRRLMMCYGRRRCGSRSACDKVRGVVAASDPDPWIAETWSI